MWRAKKGERGEKCSPDMRTNLSRFTVAFPDLPWQQVPLGGDDEYSSVTSPPMYPKAHQVGAYLEEYARRFIPKGIDFGPEDRHTAPDLGKAKLGGILGFGIEPGTQARRPFDEEDLFRLIVVGSISVVINTTAEITRASAESRATADEAELELPPMEEDGAQVKCAIEHRQNIGCPLYGSVSHVLNGHLEFLQMRFPARPLQTR